MWEACRRFHPAVLHLQKNSSLPARVPALPQGEAAEMELEMKAQSRANLLYKGHWACAGTWAQPPSPLPFLWKTCALVRQ